MYDGDVATRICEEISAGRSLRSICEDEGMPDKATVLRWLDKHEEFRDQYARAREVQADYYAEDIIEIADDSSFDVIKGDDDTPDRVNSEFVNRSRLRVDTRKWLMARMAPKKYGDKITQEVTGKDGGPVETVTRIELVPANGDGTG